MRFRCLMIFVSAFLPAAAQGASLEQALKKLSPVERANQACVIKGLDVIRREKRLPGADRLVTDTVKPSTFDGNVVSASGGAVKAKKHWYALKFSCTVTEDQMKATAFTYEIGAEIPAEKWEDYGLWQ